MEHINSGINRFYLSLSEIHSPNQKYLSVKFKQEIPNFINNEDKNRPQLASNYCVDL